MARRDGDLAVVGAIVVADRPILWRVNLQGIGGDHDGPGAFTQVLGMAMAMGGRSWSAKRAAYLVDGGAAGSFEVAAGLESPRGFGGPAVDGLRILVGTGGSRRIADVSWAATWPRFQGLGAGPSGQGWLASSSVTGEGAGAGVAGSEAARPALAWATRSATSG